MIWYLYHYWIVFKAQAPGVLWEWWEWWYTKVNHYSLGSVMVILFGFLVLVAFSQYRKMKVFTVDDETKQLIMRLLHNGEAHQKTDKSEE